MNLPVKYLFLLLLLSGFLFAQESKKVTVIPEPDFKAGYFHKLFFGTHWRDLWTAPLEVEILDLDKFAGGLTPVKRGGGQQTKSLRFKGNDGRLWKFRSMSKDPSKVLPEALRGTFVASVLKDQISSANPLAPIVVAPILQAEGVLQAKPFLCKMPDSEKLGEFREEFAGLVGMIEIHPDEEFIKADPLFDNSDKFQGTLKLLESLETKRSNKFYAPGFLKARLIDCYLGDWDRHTDQWRWARFEEKDTSFWHPIPRDRDQAFAKFTGIGPSLAEYYVPQLNNFGEDMPPVKTITWSGRFLDRRILPAISKQQWDLITDNVIAVLTDSLIEYSVAQLPEPHYTLASEELLHKLKSRRDQLKEFSGEYYNLINEVVDVYCSDEKDYVKLTFSPQNKTLVEVFKYDKNEKEPRGEPLFRRAFDNNITEELRIYLGDDDDYCIVSGETEDSPQVRIIGNDGGDIVKNSSPHTVEFYDSGKKSEIAGKGGIYYDDEKWPAPATVTERYEPHLKDRGSETIFMPVVSANDDDGLIFGLGMDHYKYDFRSDPNQYEMSLEARFATRPESYSIAYSAIFHKLFKFMKPDFSAERTKLKLTKFYGFGNETTFDGDLEENDFYRLEYEFHSINIGLNFYPFKHLRLRVGASYTFSEMELKNLFLLNNFPGNLYGLGDMHSINFSAFVRYDSRDNKQQPSSGLYAHLLFNYYPETLDIVQAYQTGNFDFRFYIPLSSEKYHVLAFRTGGAGVTNNYPFYSAAMIGGEYSLRGYNRERFAGDAALFFQSELRNYLLPVKLIIKGNLGTFFFAESGRVFTDVKSNKWHSSFGGGIWTSFLDRMFVLRISLAASEEAVLYYIDTGLAF